MFDDIAAGCLGVALDQFAAAQAAGLLGRPDDVVVQWLGIGRLRPVGERRSEIHERVADRGHLPVEHGHDLCQVGGVEDEVVKLEIVVDQARGGRLGRQVLGEPRCGALEVGDIVGAGVLISLGSSRSTWRST